MRTLQELCSAIQGHDSLEGVVTAICEPRNFTGSMDPVNEANSLVSARGYSALGDGWRQLSQSEAIEHLQEMLRTSLAYGVEMLSEEDSKNIAHELAEKFNSGASVWLTNGDRGSWNPVTKSTFENALVVVDERNIALVLFEDED